MTLYPFQQIASDNIVAAIAAGEPGIVLASPPRSGKTVILKDVIRRVLERDWRVTIYSHRILLTKQLVRTMVASDLDVGVRASGWAIDDDPRIQIASMQTEHSQVIRRQKRELSKSQLVVVDELHLQCGAAAQAIYRQHQAAGATILGMTATPVDIPTDLFTKLIVGTTNSELRAIGQHVPCITYGCEEIDTSKIKSLRDGNFSAAELRKAFRVWQIYGYVLKHWRELNPEQKPTLLFAPGVKESLWFAKEFAKNEVPAVHIDGGSVYFNSACPRYAGESFTGQAGIEKRSVALDMSEQREIKIITNRYVLREAIDLPFLEVGIGATVFGALHSFIQAGSRILTASPGKTRALWLDHGGSYWRHGSLNEDRIWHLGCTAAEFASIRRSKHISGEAEEPSVCPQCQAVRGPKWNKTGKCPACGFEYTQSVRPVLQADGTLKLLKGPVHKQRRLYIHSCAAKLWRNHYFRCQRANMTFSQAEALFAREHQWRWLPRTLPLMPITAANWVRRIRDVPFTDLYSDTTSPYIQEHPDQAATKPQPKQSLF